MKESFFLFHVGDNPSTIVLPDDTIHGTRKHRFEMHDLSDISGGKWKAVHIPDEDISSLLKIENVKKGGTNDLDIEHEQPKKNVDIDGIEVPVEIHGRVHAFHHGSLNTTKNSSRSGKLIVAMENEGRGKETHRLHNLGPVNIKLREYVKNEEPNNEEIHQKISSQPSVIVAKIPDEDDDSQSELPLQKSRDPVVASLRKTLPRLSRGAMRSKILAKVMPLSSTSSTSLPKTSPGPQRVRLVPGQGSIKNESTDLNQAAIKTKDYKTSNILDKIKSLLLKSHSSSEYTPVEVKTAGKSGSKLLEVPSQKDTAAHQNDDGLFLPKSTGQQDAFSNHANALNKISSAKREALLVGIIRALLLRNKLKTYRNSLNSNLLPHYNKQAILQGIQSLQMRKTFDNAQSNDAPARLDTSNPTSMQNLDELYQKQRDEEVLQELGRCYLNLLGFRH